MPVRREITIDEVAESEDSDDPNFLSIGRRDPPDEVAGRFVDFLERNGFVVEVSTISDLPVIYYRIGRAD